MKKDKKQNLIRFRVRPFREKLIARRWLPYQMQDCGRCYMSEDGRFDFYWVSIFRFANGREIASKVSELITLDAVSPLEKRWEIDKDNLLMAGVPKLTLAMPYTKMTTEAHYEHI